MYLLLFFAQGRVSEGFDLEDSGNLLLFRKNWNGIGSQSFRGLESSSLPPSVYAVSSCVSMSFLCPWAPPASLGPSHTLGPSPHSLQKPSNTDQSVQPHFTAAYPIVITHLLMNHLMFIALISLEAILEIRTLWLSMSRNVFAHSRCQKNCSFKRMNDFSESRMSWWKFKDKIAYSQGQKNI